MQESFHLLEEVPRGSILEAQVVKCRDCQNIRLVSRPRIDPVTPSVSYFLVNGYYYCGDCFRKLPEHVR